MIKPYHVLLLGGACLLAGCSADVVFQADVPVAGGAWAQEAKHSFAFDISDTVGTHNVFIDVRHTGDYPYQDMYLFVDLEDPQGEHSVDTVDLILADGTGRWLGRGVGFIKADRHDAHVLYRHRDRFPRTGRYTLTLEQAMRVDPLPGVIDVGVSIERASEPR